MTNLSQPVVLPRKLSALLTIALADLELVEASDMFQVDMGRWLVPLQSDSDYQAGEFCSVCFAGAVMAKTLQFDAYGSDKHEVFPNDFDDQTCSALVALDTTRQGFVGDALFELGVDIHRAEVLCKQLRQELPQFFGANGGGLLRAYRYDDDPQAFKVAMRAVAAWLAEHGE